MKNYFKMYSKNNFSSDMLEDAEVNVNVTDIFRHLFFPSMIEKLLVTCLNISTIDIMKIYSYSYIYI